MGLSRLTALIIGTRDDIIATAGGPTPEGKYVGWITLGSQDRYRPLLNTEPIYNSAEEATEAMRKSIEAIREIAKVECEGRHPIDAIMGDIPEAGAVKQILAAVHSASFPEAAG